MPVGILKQDGEIRLHRTMPASPEPFLTAMAPSREAIVGAVECRFPWYGLADLCAPPGVAFVLGHALYMKALHGGKAKHDTVGAPTSAVWRRGGMRPQACVAPAAMRATRGLLRRRVHLTRKRAALLAHGQKTHSRDTRPELRQPRAYQATREGVAARLPDPAVQKSADVDRTLLDSSARWLSDVALAPVQTAKQHTAQTLSRRQSVPGLGNMWGLVLLYERPDLARCPRLQAFASSCRRLNCAKASAGKRSGTSGKIGTASRTWAFAAAAVVVLRHNPAGQQDLARVDTHQGNGNAFTLVAHTWARAVDDRLQRAPVFERHKFLKGESSGADAPTAEPGAHGLSLTCGARMIALRQRTRRSPEALWP
jgi:hypothetical protein